MYLKDERPTTWSYDAAPRGAGMPPPERMVRPRYALGDCQNQVKRESPHAINNSTVSTQSYLSPMIMRNLPPHCYRISPLAEVKMRHVYAALGD